MALARFSGDVVVAPPLYVGGLKRVPSLRHFSIWVVMLALTHPDRSVIKVVMTRVPKVFPTVWKRLAGVTPSLIATVGGQGCRW